MPTITKYCNTYSQTADSNNAKFNNLVTLKNDVGGASDDVIEISGDDDEEDEKEDSEEVK